MFCVNVNTMQQCHKCAKTPLILTSCKGYVHIVELLLGEKNIEVNKADTQNGETALHCAARIKKSNLHFPEEDRMIIKLMMENGSDVFIQTKEVHNLITFM